MIAHRPGSPGGVSRRFRTAGGLLAEWKRVARIADPSGFSVTDIPL